ncbi:MAG: lamin tail domain-containing protein, partial [Gemmatimonadota bacterium]
MAGRPALALLLLAWSGAVRADLASLHPPLDFGQVPVAVERRRAACLVNGGPAAWVVEAAAVRGSGFALPTPPVTGPEGAVAPGDTLAVEVAFRSERAGACSGELVLFGSGDSAAVPLVAAATLVLIDEVLADPPAGLVGDANGDGVRHGYEDEFVEVWNGGPDTVSLAGWRLGDDDADPAGWFRFPDTCRLPPGGRAVVFGGGAPAGFTAPAFADDGRLGDGLANGGDAVRLVDADGDTADAVAGLDWGDGQSVVRFPKGGPFVPHASPPGTGAPFSPGRARDLSAPPPPGPSRLCRVVIAEVLADPPAGLAGDANGDGRRDGYEDEFVELYNAGPDTADLDGWLLTDGDVSAAAGFRFGPPALLAPGQRLTVFGGGVPDPRLGATRVAGGRLGNGLTNSGDDVLLIDVAGDTLDRVAVAAWPADRSLVRSPLPALAGPGDPLPPAPDPAGFVPHDAAPGRGDPFSPGRPRVVLERLEVLPPAGPLGVGDSVAMAAAASFSDGSAQLLSDQVAWLSADTAAAVFRGPLLHLRAPGAAAVWAAHLGLTSPPLQLNVERPPNRPPSASLPDTVRVRGGRWLHLDLAAADPDGDPVLLALLAAPAWLSLAEGRLHGLAPEPGEPGLEQLVVAASDGATTARDTAVLVLEPWPDLAITEILADPPSGPEGDANGDGTPHLFEDEFVEILNRGRAIDLGGWSLADDDAAEAARFRFPPGTVLERGQRLVLFGGGQPAGVPGLVFADDGRLGSGLGNRTDRLLLVAAAPPDTILDLTYDAGSIADQSLVPLPGGRAAAHGALPGWAAWSPGRERPVYAGFAIDALEVQVGDTCTAILRGLRAEGA